MTKTVLIVEDNELNMKLFRDLLEAHGIATIETRSGNNVLEIARAQKPDLILMDIQLPEVSGLDVTKWLKAEPDLKSIPVIAVTAFAMKGDEEKIRRGGCEDYISKPISVMRFLEVIQTHLNKEKPAEETTESTTEEATEEELQAATAPKENAQAVSNVAPDDAAVADDIADAAVDDVADDNGPASPSFEIRERPGDDAEDDLASFLIDDDEDDPADLSGRI